MHEPEHVAFRRSRTEILVVFSTDLTVPAQADELYLRVSRADDPGSVTLTPSAAKDSALTEFLAAVDTIEVLAHAPARIVIDARQGTVVAGGDVRIGAAVVSHRGITLQIGGTPAAEPAQGVLRVEPEAAVADVAAGLHAAGARPEEIAAIFEALRSAGALQAEVVVR